MFGDLIKLGIQAFEWGTALREAAQSEDEERVRALLPDELRSVLTLRLSKALADDLAIRNRRESES